VRTKFEKKLDEFERNAESERLHAIQNEDKESIEYWKGYKDAIFIVKRWVPP
jgi:hypothetical protein